MLVVLYYLAIGILVGFGWALWLKRYQPEMVYDDAVYFPIFIGTVVWPAILLAAAGSLVLYPVGKLVEYISKKLGWV